MEGYVIDPQAPCGRRCQIKRALGAWGGMVQVDVGSLMTRYKRMSVDRQAIKALKGASIGFQKRVDAAERSLRPEDSKKLKTAFQQLKAIDNRVKSQVQKIRVRGSSANRKVALLAAKLIDAERHQLGRYERRAEGQSSLFG